MGRPQDIVDRLLKERDKVRAGRLIDAITDDRLTRRLLVDAMFLGNVKILDSGGFMYALRRLGLGDEKDRVLALLRNPDGPFALRAVAGLMLGQVDKELLLEVAMSLDPEDFHDLNAAPLVALVEAFRDDPDNVFLLADMLAAYCRPEGSGPLPAFERVEAARRTLLVSAVFLYGPILDRPDTAPLHPPMIAAVVSEGSEMSVRLLVSLRDKATDPAARRDLQKALLTVETRFTEGGWRKPG